MNTKSKAVIVALALVLVVSWGAFMVNLISDRQIAPTTAPQVAPSATIQVAPTATPQVAPSATIQVAPTATPQVAPSATPQVAPTPAPQDEPVSDQASDEALYEVVKEVMDLMTPNVVRLLEAGDALDAISPYIDTRMDEACLAAHEFATAWIAVNESDDPNDRTFASASEFETMGEITRGRLIYCLEAGWSIDASQPTPIPTPTSEATGTSANWQRLLELYDEYEAVVKIYEDSEYGYYGDICRVALEIAWTLYAITHSSHPHDREVASTIGFAQEKSFFQSEIIVCIDGGAYTSADVPLLD